MNRYVQEKWSWVEGSHGMRMELLNSLSDADLTFNPGGQNLTFGELLRQTGEIEYSYVQSLRTFKQDWSYRNTEVGLDGTVANLKAWYQKLDDEMKEVLSAFSNEDLKKQVDRGGFTMPIEMQMEVYLQAVLIFFGKAVVYLQAMNKPLTQSMRDYIG